MTLHLGSVDDPRTTKILNNLAITEKLDDEKVQLLVTLFIALRREYEEFRKNSHVMESGIQYNARMIEQDLLVRGYKP